MSENLKLPALKSFYSHRMGLLTLDDDVLGIVSQVRQEFGNRVQIELDPDTGWYHFVEYCEDTTMRLIFSVLDLDSEDVLDRLRRADSQSRLYEDPYEAAERDQDEAQKLIDEQIKERIREHGEELAHALREGGMAPHFLVPVAIPKDIPNA